ncbi:MAG TPA: hypothetical protein VGX23_17800 [Actinocrinis sp.]|nr:hypothetical protein [Actinocrinis sp.]
MALISAEQDPEHALWDVATRLVGAAATGVGIAAGMVLIVGWTLVDRSGACAPQVICSVPHEVHGMVIGALYGVLGIWVLFTVFRLRPLSRTVPLAIVASAFLLRGFVRDNQVHHALAYLLINAVVYVVIALPRILGAHRRMLPGDRESAA